MTFISRARRPGAGSISEGLYWLDRLVEFVTLEKLLIVRQVRLHPGQGLLPSFVSSLRAFVVTLCHAFFFQAIGKGLPGTISYIDFCAAAFCMYMTFRSMANKRVPTTLNLPANLPLRIRWVHLFIADLFWVPTKVLIGILACYVVFLLIPNPQVTGTIPSSPNIALFLFLLALSTFVGCGFSFLFQAVQHLMPALEALTEVAMWFLFVSSGVYDSYSNLPEIVRPLFKLNPMLTVVEFSRAALHPGYPTGDLDLTYPMAVAVVFMALGIAINRRLRRVDVP